MLTLESFEEAAEIVKQVTQETKLIKSAYSVPAHTKCVAHTTRSAHFPKKRERRD